jgi:hypothetical protein
LLLVINLLRDREEGYTSLQSETRQKVVDLLDPVILDAAKTLIPLMFELKKGPEGRNALQHPAPTLGEAVEQILAADLSLPHEDALIQVILSKPTSWKGEPIFLPDDWTTGFGQYTEKIEYYERALAGHNPSA